MPLVRNREHNEAFSSVMISPRWLRCVVCLGSCVCLIISVQTRSSQVFFEGDAVNVKRSNRAVSKPHEKRGNRISPSRDGSQLNWIL